MSISREQAREALGLGWTPPELIRLKLICDQHQLVPGFIGTWGITLSERWVFYRDDDGHELERAIATSRGEHEPMAVCFTDGSGNKPDKPAGIGVAIYWEKHLRQPRLIAENIGNGSNNRAELMALWRALRAFPDLDQKILIRSDSEYAIGSSTQDWIANAHTELIRCIREDLAAREPFVKVEHVHGHAGVEGNEVADKLANIGRKLVTKVSVFGGVDPWPSIEV